MSTKVTVYVTRVTPYELEFNEDLPFKAARDRALAVFDDGELEDECVNPWDEQADTTRVYVAATIDGVLHEEDWDY